MQRAEEIPATDLEARKASVANLEAHIAQREERLEEWRKDIAALDARIEKRVDELVKMLAGITDSRAIFAYPNTPQRIFLSAIAIRRLL